MRIQLHKTYLIITVLVFLIELVIATNLKTGFIRYTFGDYLVVILLYCFIKSFVKAKPIGIAISVLIIAFCIETLQLFNLLKLLHLENNLWAKLILGSTFQLSDLIAYTIGVITVLAIEYKLKKS